MSSDCGHDHAGAGLAAFSMSAFTARNGCATGVRAFVSTAGMNVAWILPILRAMLWRGLLAGLKPGAYR